MADTSADNTEDAEKKRKITLEEKSKEDLIKLVKKYLNLLQKAKNKTDELSEKCSVLERQKNAAIQELQSTEKELLGETAALRKNVTELTTEKVVSSIEKDQEITELKQKLKEGSSVKTPSLREHEEQLQCLNLQLKSLKASCQCIQEENVKLEREKKEFYEKIVKLEDHKKLSDNHEDKISALSKQIEDLRKENECYMKKNYSSADKTDDISILFRDNQDLQKENEKLKTQIKTLKDDNQTLTDIDSKNILPVKEQNEFQSQVSNQYESILDQTEISKLHSCKATLETKMQELQSELERCNLEKHQLKQEVERLSSLSQVNDYKAGIELALLQGASTETLMHSCEQYRTISKTIHASRTDVKKQNTATDPDHIAIYSVQDTTGLEHALLQGGDMSYFMETNIVPSPEIVCANEEPICHNEDTMKSYEIESMHQKLIEYSDLCQDTLEENKNLQQELETLKKPKMLIHQEVNTDFDYVKNIEDIRVLSEEVDTLDERKINSSLEQNYTDLSTEIHNLYKKICTLWKENTYLELPDDDPLILLKIIEKLYSELVCNFEKKCSKLNYFNLQLELLVIEIKQGVRQKNTTTYQTENKFEENLSLLKVLLDDLVMRSNNYASKIRNFESNMITEKKNLEDELIQIKELNQFLEDENREFNVEVKKLKCILNNSHKNYSNENYYRENYQVNPELYSIDESNELDEKAVANANATTFDNVFQKGTDTYDVAIQALYITENCAVQVEPDILHKSIDTWDLTVQRVSNFSVQVEPDLLHKSIDTFDLSVPNISAFDDSTVQVETNLLECVTKDFAIQAVYPVGDNAVQVDLLSNLEERPMKNEDNALIIADLTKENKLLKEKIQEKSTLVENIHCEMDSLLANIEELNVELQEKEDDLKHSKCLNADLKKMLTKAENIKKQQNIALKIVQDSVLELKIKNNNLNDDIKSYGLTFKEFILHVNDNIMNIMKQSCISVDHYVKRCNHQEQIFNLIKEWINYLTKDFTTYLNFLDQITNKTINTLEQETYVPVLQEYISHFKASDQDVCCGLSEDIEQLNSIKLNFFFKFNNYFNNFISLVKNLDHFKLIVIPKMEKDIAALESKLAKCTCQKDTVENIVQKEHEEFLKNQLADVETKMVKLKKLAINLKKELAQTKEQYSAISSEKEHVQRQNTKLLDELNKISDDQCKYVQNFQSLQNEFDKLQDECEIYKINIKKLEEDSSTKLLEFAASKERVVGLEAELSTTKHSLESYLTTKNELEVKCIDLESKVIVLESKINEKVQKINSLDFEISKHLKDLYAVWDENKNLKNQLELAQKEENKKSLLHLEMADYERSISELNNHIFKKEEEIKEFQSELDCMNVKYDCLQEEMRSTETLKETEAKRAESLRQILEKAKLDLTQVKKHEAELLSKNASLEIQLETLIQQEEQTKLRQSEASAQVQHLQDVIKTSSDNHQRIIRSFEQKISNQKEEILAAHKEVESVKQEFENYKIRVHSVLKQQKSATPAITTVDADLKEKLETMNEKLKMQVKDLSEKLTALSLEYEALQEEHDGLLQRYNKAIDDREVKDKEWHQRLEQVNSEKNRLRATQEELSSQHLLQNEMLGGTYKKQIKIMSDEHKRIVSDLQKQLDNADVEIARLQRDQQKQQGLPLTPLPQDIHPFDIMTQERQEGEGSENTDETTTPIKHLSLATIPTPGFLPFEKLIQSPLEPGTPASYISSHDSEKLSSNLNTANKKIGHLNELLNDCESTNMRLSEQVRVLKEEVRRLENNKEREQHAENLEYLKNVFIKFASLQPGSEKAMLIPVLTTMLKLSSSEQQQLKSVSGDFDTDDYSNSGWSSYLHRWSGLS